MDNRRLGGVLRLMHSLNFTTLPSKGITRKFRGRLSCKAGEVEVELSISDWDLLNYPTIRILEKPDFFPKTMAHQVTDGSFCYLSNGEVVLDRYDPAGSILFCLNQATGLLDKLIASPERNQEDFEAEFLAYWTAPNQGKVLRIGVGNISAGAKTAKIFTLVPGERIKKVISTDDVTTAKMAQTWEELANEDDNANCWIYSSTIQPPFHKSLPWKIKDTLSWLKIWDISLYKKIQLSFETDSKFLDSSQIYILINCPAGLVGFGFTVSSKIKQKLALSKGGKYRGKALFQFLHSLGGQETIYRLHAVELSHNFINSRNLTSSLGFALAGRKVLLIGCGAIGGYLAQALARLGAGHSEGKLELYDPQNLMPENLGRHALGFKYLFRSKALSLQEDLSQQLPGIIIEAHSTEMRSPGIGNGFDLIINATGEEAISEMLNEYQINDKDYPPLIHIWIKGNGETVQALWTDREFGCFRCLRSAAIDNQMQERFPVLKGEVERSYRSCQHYTPYAVSAAISATALAIDIINDWLKTSDPSPRFRTRSVETADVFKVKNQNISRANGCPACAKK